MSIGLNILEDGFNVSKVRIGQGRLTTCRMCGFKFRIKLEDKDDWQKNNLICPQCKEIYCVLPKTERKLRILQDKFFESRRKECYMTEMYKILIPYTKSLLLKSFPAAIHSNEEADEKTHMAVSFLIEEYYAKLTYKLDISFGGMLLYKIKQALYGKQEFQTSDISLDYQFEDGNQVEYEDKKNNAYEHIENEHDKYLICKFITELLFSIGHFADSEQERYICETCLYLFFMKGEKKVENYFKVFGREGKILYLYSLDILKKELEKLCKIKVEKRTHY
jgi:hypothetical protein